MKISALLLLIFSVFHVSAQNTYQTGSTQLDSDLSSISAQANLNFGTFKADMGVTYNIGEKKIDQMHASIGMQAGEIYLALEIAKITRKSIDEILVLYQSNKNKGWGYIAKQAGIKQGSSEFHALKNNASSQKNKGKGKGNGKGKSKKKG